jgi:hypothetical protein
MLTAAGYRLRSSPVTVASVPFDFAAVLIGADRTLDLIIVIDTLEEDESRVLQKVQALSRALDLVVSRRSLTVILVGPPPRATIIEALSRVCRVLPVGTPTGEGVGQFLNDALAVLLPLNLPHMSEAVADPLGEVHKRLSTEENDLETLLAAAPMGAKAVQEALRALIQEPLRIDPETEQL